MRTTTVVLASVLATGTAACGGGGGSAPDVAGMYQIDTHTESLADPGGAPATCDGQGPAVTSPGYLQLSYDEFGGSRDLAWGLCDTTEATSCDQDFYTFHDVSGGWDIGAATSAAYSGGGCTLFHAEGGVEQDGGDPANVRLELKVWDEYETIPEEDCTLGAADDLAGQDDCDRHVVIGATLL